VRINQINYDIVGGIHKNPFLTSILFKSKEIATTNNQPSISEEKVYPMATFTIASL